jgi:hypothetical protein
MLVFPDTGAVRHCGALSPNQLANTRAWQQQLLPTGLTCGSRRSRAVSAGELFQPGETDVGAGSDACGHQHASVVIVDRALANCTLQILARWAAPGPARWRPGNVSDGGKEVYWMAANVAGRSYQVSPYCTAQLVGAGQRAQPATDPARTAFRTYYHPLGDAARPALLFTQLASSADASSVQEPLKLSPPLERRSHCSSMQRRFSTAAGSAASQLSDGQLTLLTQLLARRGSIARKDRESHGSSSSRFSWIPLPASQMWRSTRLAFDSWRAPEEGLTARGLPGAQPRPVHRTPAERCKLDVPVVVRRLSLTGRYPALARPDVAANFTACSHMWQGAHRPVLICSHLRPEAALTSTPVY